MGSLRVCPRTGMIIKGPGVYRPNRFPVTQAKNKIKSDNTFPAEPSPAEPSPAEPRIVPEAPSFPNNNQGFNPDQIKELAHEIGRAVAESMKGVITERVIVSGNQPVRGTTPMTKPSFNIEIDESIADVGIGKTQELVKGEQSGKIAKEALKTENIGSSLEKLRKLKKTPGL